VVSRSRDWRPAWCTAWRKLRNFTFLRSLEGAPLADGQRLGFSFEGAAAGGQGAHGPWLPRRALGTVLRHGTMATFETQPDYLVALGKPG